MDEEKWVLDSSLDHKGMVPFRASTGSWKASIFLIVIGFCESLTYFGISGNLITYLTNVMHQDIKNAAKNINYWAGATTMMSLIGGFLADAYFGRFYMVLISSFVYVKGLCVLIASQVIPSLKPSAFEKSDKSQRLHEVVFFLGMFLIAVGIGGHKPSLEGFGADQFDDYHPEERKKKECFFNWWISVFFGGLLLGVTVIVYMQDKGSWASSYIILTILMSFTIILFCSGKSFYRYRAPQGSPLTPLLRVLVAVIAKRKLPYRSDSAQLHQVPDHLAKNQRKNLPSQMDMLRFLDKAAILEENEDTTKALINNQQSPWRLASVNEVEVWKLVLNMVPIWLCSLLSAVCLAQISTFFVKQASTMNRKIGHGFEVPPASTISVAPLGSIVFFYIYDRIILPKLRRVTGHDRGFTHLQRIGIGMMFSMVSMFVAAGIENKRLEVAKTEIVEVGGRRGNAVVSMSVFWLAPQLLINGIGDGFALVGLQEYFYGQVPYDMRSIGIALYLSVLAVANFLSGWLITIVDYFTSRGETGSWFGKELNQSRLDKFYLLIAAMNGVNLCIYWLLATMYSYNHRVVSVEDSGGQNEDKAFLKTDGQT